MFTGSQSVLAAKCAIIPSIQSAHTSPQHYDMRSTAGLAELGKFHL